jgi:predicted ATP-dependent endonuclease of OLD family
MVKIYSNDLAEQMQKEMNDAGQRGADIDRSFPVRLLKSMKGHKSYDPSALFMDLRKLEEYRHQLSSVSLLLETSQNNADDELIKELDGLDMNMLSVMHLYVKDSWEKLKKYDNIYNKVSILMDIINTRFNHKVLQVDSKRGFVFLSSHNPVEDIPVEKLSSGEQNELVLFYELLFKCDSKDLILIDEPEISLHLTWLQAMIGDLKRITEVNGASLLIATHSPDFVGDNYELVQNLE